MKIVVCIFLFLGFINQNTVYGSDISCEEVLKKKLVSDDQSTEISVFRKKIVVRNLKENSQSEINLPLADIDSIHLIMGLSPDGKFLAAISVFTETPFLFSTNTGENIFPAKAGFYRESTIFSFSKDSSQILLTDLSFSRERKTFGEVMVKRLVLFDPATRQMREINLPLKLKKMILMPSDPWSKHHTSVTYLPLLGKIELITRKGAYLVNIETE